MRRSSDGGGAAEFLDTVRITVDFAHDNSHVPRTAKYRALKVLYMSHLSDPIDIAVIEVEPPGEIFKPLEIRALDVPQNLYVVGHPGRMQSAPSDVQAVFGNPDERKRVSFGKPMKGIARAGEFLHDASTIGGYSGAPVVSIAAGAVTGLHYYGDPRDGNRAIMVTAIKSHPAAQFIGQIRA